MLIRMMTKAHAAFDDDFIAPRIAASCSRAYELAHIVQSPQASGAGTARRSRR